MLETRSHADELTLSVSLAVSLCSLLVMALSLVTCAWCCRHEVDSDEYDDMSYLEAESKSKKSTMPDLLQPPEHHDGKIKRTVRKLRKLTRKEKVVVPPHPGQALSVQPVQPDTRGTGRGASMAPHGQFLTVPTQPDVASDSELNQVAQSPRHKHRRMGLLNAIRHLDLAAVEQEILEEQSQKPRGQDVGLGRLEFSVNYDFTAQTLVVCVRRAHGVAARDLCGTSDPYVRISLEGGKKTRMQTKVRKRTLNPVWNESFQYEGFPFAKLTSRILVMQVMDYDMFSRDDVLGEVRLPLTEVNFSEGTVDMNYNIQYSSSNKGTLGDIQLSLSYNQSLGRLVMVVLRARNLKAMDLVGGADPYVKIWMVCAGVRIEKKKTRIIRNCLNPVWNESFMFELPSFKLKETTFHIKCVDYDMFSKNDPIGEIVFSYKATGKELSHWTEATTQSTSSVIEWHSLKKCRD